MSICSVGPVKRKARLTMLSRCGYRIDRHRENHTRKGIRHFFAFILIAWVVLTATTSGVFAQISNQSSSFTDLSADDDGRGQISVLPGSLTFAAQVEGTTGAAQIVTIKNPSNAVVNLLIALSGDEDYVPYDTCIGSMAAGTSCTISVTFRPTNIGHSTGTLTITDLDKGYSQSVALAGSGAQQSSPSPAIALSSSVASLQLTAVVQTATSHVYITSENGFQGQVNLQCKIVAGGQEGPTVSPTCSLSRSQVTISGESDSSSELSLSTQTTDATAKSRLRSWTSMSLTGLAALGLLPLGRWRKQVYACLTLPLIGGMIGCGYVPNAHTATSLTSSSSYRVLVTATSGIQSTAISIPFEVK